MDGCQVSGGTSIPGALPAELQASLAASRAWRRTDRDSCLGVGRTMVRTSC